MKTTSLKTTTTQTVYEFTKADILHALVKAGKLPPTTVYDADAFVRVPGGGDWSNTNLDLADHPLQVKVVTKEQEES